MNQTERLAKRAEEVLLNGRWVANTNFKDQLENTTWEQAIKKVGSLNTIAAITYHVQYYLAGLNDVFDGGPLEIKDKYSFDFPPIQSESDWQNLVNQFLSNAEAFVSHVSALEDEVLEKPFVNKDYGTYQRNIEGVVEHCYYHLGQVSLIRKMVVG